MIALVFQIAINYDNPAQLNFSFGSVFDFNNPIFIALISIGLFSFGLIIVLLVVRKILQSNLYLIPESRKILLQVTVPKESSDKAEEQESIEKIREHIAFAESWFSTLGGLRVQKGWRTWLWGRYDHFSLEIVAKDGEIYFYVAVPKFMLNYMEQQLLAQYPEANIVQVEDYNIFSPTSSVASGFLRFTQQHLLPIKTYRQLDTDLLSSITNSLSGLNKEDAVALQIIARSSHKKWHIHGSKIARQMQKGKTYSEALQDNKFFSFAKLFRSSKPKDKGEEDKGGLSPMDQELIKRVEEKTSKAGLDCNIRIFAVSKNKETAQDLLKQLFDSFSQVNFYQYGNSLVLHKRSPKKMINDYIYRRYKDKNKMIFNTEELATLFHLPNPFLDTPNIHWLLAKKLPVPANMPKEGLLLGENIYRGVKQNIYLPMDDRRSHQYIIGMTGTGKSVLFENLIIQDIRAGRGVCVIDPHGSLVETVLANIPKERMDDVIYFNPADIDRPMGLNMLEAKTPEEQDFAVQEMIAIFYKLVTDPSMVGPMFEHNMRNAMLTLMADKEDPGTMAEIPRIFSDTAFQKYKVSKVTDPMVRSFWEKEMAKTSDFHKSEMLGYLISKVGRFVENAMVRNIIGQPRSGFNFRQVMDEGKILLVNLSKGQVGEVNSNLLGLIIVAKLQMAALSRTDIPEDQRRDFYLYIDEFQNFITDSIATILSEARKYKLNLILAHQYIGQLTEGTGPEGKVHGSKIRDAVFGNVGSIMSFRIGVEDAEFIGKQMAPQVNNYDLINIEKYNAYVRLLIDNHPTKAFNIRTFPPPEGSPETKKAVVEFSRWKYGVDRKTIEDEILKRSKLGETKVDQPLEKTL